MFFFFGCSVVIGIAPWVSRVPLASHKAEVLYSNERPIATQAHKARWNKKALAGIEIPNDWEYMQTENLWGIYCIYEVP